jgi:hypothetical protein
MARFPRSLCFTRGKTLSNKSAIFVSFAWSCYFFAFRCEFSASTARANKKATDTGDATPHQPPFVEVSGVGCQVSENIAIEAET